MLSYLAIGAAVNVLCIVVGAGFYIGVKHIEKISQIPRNRGRPEWAQESVDTFNRIVGRPTSPEYVERRLEDGDDSEDRT
jgi:hypothetical protein